MSTYWITVLISLLIFVIGFVFLYNCREVGERQTLKIKRKYILFAMSSSFIFAINLLACLVFFLIILFAFIDQDLIFCPKSNLIKKCVDWLNLSL